jgi:HEPN domain-containing protein
MNSPRDHALALLARAEGDLYVVRRLQTEPDAPRWVLGFHAQQGVEKALKAVLSAAGLAYPRTHNLVMLAELLRTAALPLPPDCEEFGRLTPFGVALRYEDIAADEPLPLEPVRLEAVVAGTIGWARERLKRE